MDRAAEAEQLFAGAVERPDQSLRVDNDDTVSASYRP